MPLDFSQPQSQDQSDDLTPQQVDRDFYYDRQTAGQGFPLASSSTYTPTYQQPSQRDLGTTMANVRGYDPLRTTAHWEPNAQPLTGVFNPFPQTSPKTEEGESAFLLKGAGNMIAGLGDQAIGLGRTINQAVGGNQWFEDTARSLHKSIQGYIQDNITSMGEGHRAAYEGSILRSIGIGPETDEQGNKIPGLFEGGGGAGRFANWAAAQIMNLIPAGVAGLVTGGTGAIAMLSAQGAGDAMNRMADHVADTPDSKYQAENAFYRDLRQNRGMTEHEAKQQMLQYGMLGAMAEGAATGVGGALGMRGAPSAWGPVLRRVWGAVMGGAGFGAAGYTGSVAEQAAMGGDVDQRMALREAFSQGAQGVGMGLIFGAHPRGRGETETKPPGEPDASTRGVGDDERAALAATRPPEQTEMFTSTQMGPTVARGPEPPPTAPTSTVQPPGTAPIGGDRTPGYQAPQPRSYAIDPNTGQPIVTSTPEGMAGASQLGLPGTNTPTTPPSGPIVPPTRGGPGGGGPAPGPIPPRPAARGTQETTAPAATQAAVATSKARGQGKTEVTSVVPPEVEQAAQEQGALPLPGAAGTLPETAGEGLTPGTPEAAATERPVTEAAASAQAQPQPLSTRDMRAQLVEWGYKKSQVKNMLAAEVKAAHDKGPPEKPAEAAPPAEQPVQPQRETEAQAKARALAEGKGEVGEGMAGMGQGLGESLRDHLWSRFQKGETRETSTMPPSPVLAAAKALKDAGHLVSRGKFEQFLDDFTGAQRRGFASNEDAWKFVTDWAAKNSEKPKEDITLAATQAEPAAEAEAERVPPEERVAPPAAPREEKPPVAQPLTGRALERARMAQGREQPVRGEVGTETRAPETIQGEEGRRELAAPETPEARREALNAQVQTHAEQVIQPKGKADIKAAVAKATRYIQDIVNRSDGTQDGVAEEMNRSLPSLPKMEMPGTTTTYRAYVVEMMKRLTGREPLREAGAHEEVRQVQAEEQSRQGAEPTNKVSGENIEEAIAQPAGAQGALPLAEPVARKAPAESVTNKRVKAENLIKRLRDGDITPAEAQAEFDKPEGASKAGAKPIKGLENFRNYLMSKLAKAADTRGELKLLDQINKLQNDKKLTAKERNPKLRALTNELKEYGVDAAQELQDWIERLDDPVGKAVEDENAKGRYLEDEHRGIPAIPDAIGPRSSRGVQMALDPRMDTDLIRQLQEHEHLGQPAMLHDLLRSVMRMPLVRAELPMFRSLATRLLSLVQNVPVYTNDLARRLDINPARGYGVSRINILDPSQNHIVLNPTMPHQSGTYVGTLLHEAVHQVHSRYLYDLMNADPNHPDVQILRAIADEIENHYGRDLYYPTRGREDLSPAERQNIANALTNARELHTMIMTDPVLQAWMASHEASPEFRARAAELGFAPREQGRSLWRFFTDAVRKVLGLGQSKSASETAFLDHVLQAGTDITERAAKYNERFLPQDPVLRGPAQENYWAVGNALTGERARNALDYVNRTVDSGKWGDRFRRAMLASATTDGIVSRYGQHLPALQTVRDAAELIQYAGKAFSDKYADRVKDIAGRITRADNRDNLQSLMNDATLNEMALRPGGDNNHLDPAQHGLLRELQDRYNNLSAKDKETYGLATDLHGEQYQALRDARLTSLINTYMPEASEDEQRDFIRAARTQKGLENYVENLDVSRRAVARLIADYHNLGYVRGDYFPLRRFGNYVVRYGDRDNLQDYGVEFYENRSKAEARIAQLKANNVADVYRLAQKQGDEYLKEVAPSHPAVDALVNKLRDLNLTDEQKDAIREQLHASLVQMATRTERSRLQQTYRRQGIRGASPDQARAMAHDFVSNSQTIGHLLWGPARAKALANLKLNVEALERPSAPEDAFSAVAARSVLNEMSQRAKAANDPDNWLYNAARKANIFNYAHSLMSLSHMVTSTMEAHTNSIALGGARYGYGKFSLNLTRALMQLGPKLAKEGAWNTIKGVASELKATDWNLAHVARDRLIKGGANASHMNKLFDALERAGLIDHTIMTDLRRQASASGVVTGMTGDVWNRYMNLTQASAHAVDVMNKSAIAKATFDSAFSRTKDVDQAIAEALEMSRKAMPNYNTPNKARIARGLMAPVMQFKNYGIHMYTVMANLAHDMVRGENKWEATKAFTGLLATHSMMAGVLTLTDPLKYIWGAYDLITSGHVKDREATMRGWLSDAFGKTTGELLGRGLPHAVGIDVHHRVGLSNLLELPEFKGLDKDSAKNLLFGLALGATGENLQDYIDAAGKLTQGDVGGVLKEALPRNVRDLKKSYDLMTQGVTDSKGKVVLPASKLGWGAGVTQGFGFQPAGVSEFREGRNAAIAERSELQSQHARLEQQWVEASPAQRKSIQDKIKEFNADATTKRWGMGVTQGQLLRAQHAQAKQAREPFGLRVPAKATKAAEYAGRFANAP